MSDVLRDYEAHTILCDIQRAEAGHGGFGTVIVGKHKYTGFVAIKYFPVNGGEREQRTIKKMAHREYDMLLRSRHENISHVFGLTKWRGAMGIVMRYYEAGNLRCLLLDTDIPLGMSLVLRLAYEISDGITYIHNCGINKRLIHGDMKPENILLTIGLNVKIADFGCAYLANFTGSTTNQNPQEKPAMTLYYAAPEKFEGAEPKKEQDVFSCAIIFYVMLRRVLPYPSEQIFWEMIRNIIRPNCDAIQEMKNRCSDNDRAIVQVMERMMTRCWEQNPTQRPNMLDVRDEFQQHLATQDPAVITQQVADAVKEMEIIHPAAEHNPTVPLHQLNPVTGEFYSESIQPPEVQLRKNPSQSQNPLLNIQPTPVQPQQNPSACLQQQVIESFKHLQVEPNENPPEHSQHQALNATACRAYGRGIQPTGVQMRKRAEFFVSVENAGDADLKAVVKGPRGNEPVTINKSSKPNVYDCEYYPLEAGDHTVSVTYGGKPIARSPFQVAVGNEASPQKVRAYGPGLHEGKVGHSADFVVETTGSDDDQLSISIEGPSRVQIDGDDLGDGSCDVKYYPTEAGEYAVHVICDDNDITGSPFMAQIEPADAKTNPDKVKAFGPGLNSGEPVCGHPTSFTVDAQCAGDKAPVNVYAETAEGEDIPVNIKEKHHGTYECSYSPQKPTKHTFILSYNGVAVKDSPFRVAVQESSYPDKVEVHGPGVESGLKAEGQTYFTVD